MATAKHVVLPSAFGVFFTWIISAQYAPIVHVLPYAFVVGVIFGLSGSFYIQSYGSRSKTEPNDFTSTRILGLSQRERFEAERRFLIERQDYHPQPLTGLSPPLAQSLEHLLRVIVRNHVSNWLGKLTSGTSFSNQVDRTIRLAINSAIRLLQGKDFARVVVTRALPIFNDHLTSFIEAERLTQNAAKKKIDAEVANDDLQLTAKFRSGHLHPAASIATSKSSVAQQRYIREMVEEYIPILLPRNITASPSVRVIIREILACAVLCPVLLLVSESDFIFQQIDVHGRQFLRSPEVTIARRQSLRAQGRRMSDSEIIGERETSQMLGLHAGDDAARYEEFLKRIKTIGSTKDAKQARSYVMKQMQAAASTQPIDRMYLVRLETGKRMLDQQVASLTSTNNKDTSVKATPVPTQSEVAANRTSLRETLYDVAGLSAFMEYMDKYDLIILVQFWITVDGLLASLNVSENGLGAKSETNIKKETVFAGQRMIGTINAKFLSQPTMYKIVRHHRAVEAFLQAGGSATSMQYRQALHALSQAQNEVYEEMQTHYYPGFEEHEANDPGSETEVRTNHLNAPATNGRPSLNKAVTSQVAASNAPTTTLKPVQQPSLRKFAASSDNLTRDARKTALLGATRRSLDHGTRKDARKPLFGEPDEDSSDAGNMSESITSLEGPGMRQSLDSDFDTVHSADESDLDTSATSLQGTSSGMSSSTGDLRKELPASSSKPIGFAKPSLNSLGLLGTPSKRTVFLTDDLFGERETLWEDEENNPEATERGDEVREANAGDLGLPEAIASLNTDVGKLEAQQAVLQNLLSKAELTNNSAELKILRKSVSDLERDLRQKQLQRQQYIVQNNDNKLYQNSIVSIDHVEVGTDIDGREFALYRVRIQRHATSTIPAANWSVTRRYSQFHDLHRRLRHRFPFVRELPFPKRQVVATLQRDFVQKRRVTLERYLQKILEDPAVCQCIEVRAFLSEVPIRAPRLRGVNPESNKRDLVSRIYASLSEGLEDFVGNTTVLDQVSLAGQNLISAATATSIGAFTGGVRPQQEDNNTQNDVPASTTVPLAASNPAVAAEAQAEISAYDKFTESESPTALKSSAATLSNAPAVSFIGPIAECFTTTFQTQAGNNWLRGRAVVIVLQQLLGGTVERRIRDTFNALTTPLRLSQYIDNLRGTLWPNDQPRPPVPLRSKDEKIQTRRNAETVLSALFVENAGSVIGKTAARDAAKRLMRCLDHDRLNMHLLFTLIDDLVPILLRSKDAG